MTELVFAAVVVVVGGAMTAFNLHDARKDLKVLGNHRNGRRIIARSDMRSQTMGAVMFAAWTVPVVVVVFDLIAPSETRGTVLTWFLLAGMAAGAVNATLDRLTKRRLIREHMGRRPPAAAPPDLSDG